MPPGTAKHTDFNPMTAVELTLQKHGEDQLRANKSYTLSKLCQVILWNLEGLEGVFPKKYMSGAVSTLATSLS